MRFPYHGAGIGLVKDGCLLMGRRSDKPFYGRWAVPGGGRDKVDSDDFDYEPHSDEFSEFEWVPLERLTGKGKDRKKHLRPFTRSEVRLLQENLS